VSRLEERLRDAYQGAADTVRPETVRDLGEPTAPRLRPRPRPSRWWRGLTPLAAAAAVTVIAVLAAVLPKPSAQDRGGPAPGPAAAPKFVITDPSGGLPLQVRNEATGALVARVTLPADAAAGGRTYIGSVATADGYHYVVSLYRLDHCRSWLYQFQLNARGQPSEVRPFAAVPTVGSALLGLTVSGDGQTIAYTTTACPGSAPRQGYVAVTDIRTGQTKKWSVPGAGSLSLTANGSMLYYSTGGIPGSSGVRGMPTSAAPGPAVERSRTVVRAAAFGPTDVVNFAAVSPDGSTLYFVTFPVTRVRAGPGRVRALNLATGQLRVVYTTAGQPALVTADPAVQNLLLVIFQERTGLRLARLDLATGRVTSLPSSWVGSAGPVFTW
jgi:hypothetical protein